MYLLATFRYAFPKGTADEAIEFIAMHSTNPRLYSRADITLGIDTEEELHHCLPGVYSAQHAPVPPLLEYGISDR